jgi:hypothetical protein
LVAHSKTQCRIYPLLEHQKKFKTAEKDPSHPDVVLRYLPNLDENKMEGIQEKLHTTTKENPIPLPHSFRAKKFYYPAPFQITIILVKEGLPRQAQIAKLTQNETTSSKPLYGSKKLIRLGCDRPVLWSG